MVEETGTTLMAYRVCRTCGKKKQTASFVGPTSRVCNQCKKKTKRKNAHVTHMRKTYEIDGNVYALLLEGQNGVCAICLGKRVKKLDVDHDHKAARETGSVRDSIRGLLCPRCNRRLLVAALNNPEILRRAALYLESPPARTIIRDHFAI